jgi:hypothetical protein
VKNKARRCLESPAGISLKVRAKKNYEKFATYLQSGNPPLRVPVVGGCILGGGMQAVLACQPPIDLVETDNLSGAA